jgi:hypothetical protein
MRPHSAVTAAGPTPAPTETPTVELAIARGRSAMMRWGDRWLFPEGGRVELRHTDCGSPVHAVLQCEAGHDVAPDAIDLAVRPRPSAVA